MLPTKSWKVALIFAAASTPRAAGMLTAKTFSSKTALSANRLQEYTALRNEYFALRHGQSQANVAKIIASDPYVACFKYGLSPLGKQQAQKAGLDVVQYYVNQQKMGTSFDGVCLLTSDLLRAKETAQAVAHAIQRHNENDPAVVVSLYNDSIVVDTRLRERRFGEWDLSSDANYQEVWKDDAIDPTHTHKGVESVEFVMDRVTGLVCEWDERLENTMIVCVAHGDVLQILQTSFHKMDGSKHRTLEHLETATLRRLELF